MIEAKTDKSWFLYMIKMANGKLYTGITTDIARRFNEHSSSKIGAKALKGKGPLTLVYAIMLPSKSDAYKAEIWMKKQSRLTKLSIINDDTSPQFSHEKQNIRNIHLSDTE